MPTATHAAPATEHASTDPSLRAPTSRVGRRLLAAALVAQPLLIFGAMTVHPEVTDRTGAAFVEAAAAHPTRWFVVHLVATIGALLGIAVAFGLRQLAGGRGRRTANAGVALALLGNTAVALGFAFEATLFRLVSSSGLDGASAAHVGDRFLDGPETVILMAGFPVMVLATTLLAVGLHLGRAVPRWQPVLLVVALAASLTPPGSPVGLAGGLALVAVMTSLAVRLARRGD